MIRLKGIGKSFGPVQALTDVDFSVTAGRVHALVGENGAGKSTLMKILAGVLQPSSGEIFINGQKTVFQHPRQALGMGIAMIYQELDLIEELTVAQNIFLGDEPLTLMGVINTKKLHQAAQTLIDQHQFTLDSRAFVKNLSVADCQLVEILKALNRQASIIVMDEPTASLSKQEVDGLHRCIEQLKHQGKAVIYISHRLEEVWQLADEISVLRDGQLVKHGGKDTWSIESMVKCMVGRSLDQYYPPHQRRPGDPLLKVSWLDDQDFGDLSFQIASGEVVGVAGLMGAGRTRLARSLFGLNQTPRTIMVNNQTVKVDSPMRALQCGLAYLSEDRKRSGSMMDIKATMSIRLPKGNISLTALFT